MSTVCLLDVYIDVVRAPISEQELGFTFGDVSNFMWIATFIEGRMWGMHTLSLIHE